MMRARSDSLVLELVLPTSRAPLPLPSGFTARVHPALPTNSRNVHSAGRYLYPEPGMLGPNCPAGYPASHLAN